MPNISFVNVNDIDYDIRDNRHSNPNILDNAYFADPINQRGGQIIPPGVDYHNLDWGNTVGYTDRYYPIKRWEQYANLDPIFEINGVEYVCSHSKAVRGYTGNWIYTIDRWLVYGGATATLENGTIHLVGTSTANGGFLQLLDNAKQHIGRTVTVSALVKGKGVLIVNNTYLATNITAIGFDNSDYDVISSTFVFNPDSPDETVGTLLWSSGSDPADCYCKAMKLEYGTEQTLAHQEGNAWVLNDPPPHKALELAKCQRYQISLSPRISYGTLGVGCIENATKASIIVPLTTEMRGSVTLIRDGSYRIADSTLKTYSVSDISVEATERNCVRLGCTISGATTSVGNYCTLQANNSVGATFLFDANL